MHEAHEHLEIHEAEMSHSLIWQPTLDGSLLHLRPLAKADWEALYTVANDPLLWAGHPIPDRWQPPLFRIYFDSVMAKGGAMAVFDRSSSALIGSSTFHSYQPGLSQIEIGNTFLARSHWGGVFNGELKRLMLTHAFNHVERVVFRIGEANVRSRRACVKIGGRLTDRVEIIDGPHGQLLHHVYEICRDDFEANTKASANSHKFSVGV